MEISRSIDKSTRNLKFMNTSEEEIEQSTIKIKEEFDEINGCEFHSIITIENDPFLNKKPKLRRKKYTCYNCDHSFFSKSKLKRHLIIHTRQKVDNENCPLQFTSTNGEENKRPNIQAIEIKKETDLINSCDVCGVKITHLSNLRRHKFIHTSEKPYTCDVCGKSFTQSNNLKRHKFVHTSEKPHTCDICRKSFTRLSSLNKHNLIHTEERPFKCKVCKESFRDKLTLTVHTKTHTGDKPYKCNVCGLLISQFSHIKRHMFIHTSEKPYTCDVCGKSFAQLSNLERHKFVHTSEKPHTCDICGKSFTRLSSLNNHNLKHVKYVTTPLDVNQH